MAAILSRDALTMLSMQKEVLFGNLQLPFDVTDKNAG